MNTSPKGILLVTEDPRVAALATRAADAGRKREQADEQGGRMTEDEKARPGWRPPGRHPVSKWWLLAKDENPGAGVLLVDCGGEQALPVFSGEGEAEMFVWLGGAFEDGWRVRETSAGEIISILYDPCAGVGRVALDPSPVMVAEARPDSVSRDRFVGWIVDSACSFSPGACHHAWGVVRLA